MPSLVSRGYSSRRSSMVSPAANQPSTSTTVIRVPATVGFPNLMFGSRTISSAVSITLFYARKGEPPALSGEGFQRDLKGRIAVKLKVFELDGVLSTEVKNSGVQSRTVVSPVLNHFFAIDPYPHSVVTGDI